MSSTSNQGGFCKTLCWGLGFAVGGYTAYALVTDFQVEQVQAGVLGIVTALLVGLILRRILCRGNSNRLRKRLQETPAQTEQEASAVMASAAAKVAAEKAVEMPANVEKVTPDATPKPEPKPARIKVKAKDAIKDEIASDKPAKVQPFKAPEVEKIDETLVDRVESAEPVEMPEDAVAQGEDAPLKLSPILEVAPEMPVETEIVTPSPEPEKVVITGDYAENEVSEATKAVIADIAPVVDAPDIEPEDATEAVEETPAPIPEPTPVPAQDDAPKIKPLQPAGLDAPENGTPDDLEQIDGIDGEQVDALHKAGIYHFAQFVTMNRRELAWLDENIPGGGDDMAGGWRKQAIQLSRKAS
jgi:predicted flap endonuclease-1-like 5' DNA nuclease